MVDKKTGRYIIIFPVFNSHEVYHADTLAQVREKIEYFTQNEEDVSRVKVFELKREIDVKAMFKGRAGRNINMTIDDSLPEGVTEEEYKTLEDFIEKLADRPSSEIISERNQAFKKKNEAVITQGKKLLEKRRKQEK